MSASCEEVFASVQTVMTNMEQRLAAAVSLITSADELTAVTQNLNEAVNHFCVNDDGDRHIAQHRLKAA